MSAGPGPPVGLPADDIEQAPPGYERYGCLLAGQPHRESALPTRRLSGVRPMRLDFATLGCLSQVCYVNQIGKETIMPFCAHVPSHRSRP